MYLWKHCHHWDNKYLHHPFCNLLLPQGFSMDISHNALVTTVSDFYKRLRETACISILWSFLCEQAHRVSKNVYFLKPFRYLPQVCSYTKESTFQPTISALWISVTLHSIQSFVRRSVTISEILSEVSSLKSTFPFVLSTHFHLLWEMLLDHETETGVNGMFSAIFGELIISTW